MGGDSLIKLMRFPPGELPSPGTPLIHSAVLRVVLLVAYEVADIASCGLPSQGTLFCGTISRGIPSKAGEGTVFPWEGTLVGFRSGDCVEEAEFSEVDSLLALPRLDLLAWLTHFCR